MATGENSIPSLPVGMMAEVERLAREQDRTVNQVLAEAVDRYLKDEQWRRLRVYGSQRAAASCLTEDDVPRVIEEARRA